jgi:hypothetical protein
VTVITTKNEFLALWNAGHLGNKPRTWPDLAAALDGDYRGCFSCRDGRPDSRLSRYNVPYDRLIDVVAEMEALGARWVHFNESAPDDRLTIQGEYLDGFVGGSLSGTPWNKYLMWGTEQTQMKRVKQWHHTQGSASLAILRAYLNDNSWDDFQALLEAYPNHIIEFSAYECFVGNLPGRNTLIWEVRGSY